MQIKGLAKTTLLDYPGHVAATVFVGGCDFSCPFCHNKSLVVNPGRLQTIPLEDIYTFLEKRQGALDGLCITGGEPLMQEDLCDFIYNVKLIGYDVKLDTNGYDPTHLNHILKNNLVDYISMDIKNCQKKYSKSAGKSPFDLTRIKLSVDLLKDSGIPYEFRTTVSKELHTRADLEAIGQWLYGARAYYLQPYVETDDVIMPVFSSYTYHEMLEFQEMLSPYISYVGLRGYERK